MAANKDLLNAQRAIAAFQREKQDRLNELCALLGESSIHQTRSNGSIDQYD